VLHCLYSAVYSVISDANIIWEREIKRSALFREGVNKYGWVEISSSFLPSEIIAAYLWAQKI